MICGIGAEWRKLATVRSTWWTLVVVAVTGLGSSLIMAFAAATKPTGFAPITGIYLAWAEYPVIAIGVFGALAATTEFSSGLIRTTFLVAPRRWTVVVTKAVVVGGLSLTVGQLLAWIAAGCAVLVMRLKGRSLSLADGATVRVVVMAGVAMACIALMALALGAIVRRTAAAVVSFPALLFLPLVALTVPWDWATNITKFGPLEAAYSTISPTQPADLLPLGSAVVVLVLWPALLLVVAGVLFERRDV